ncbi:hypothetical protein C8F01DRAFT_1173933 [Mycena amicta]|nr:hypothetical protein C8F01DRAFT_1173933 [Mycena amicta]
MHWLGRRRSGKLFNVDKFVRKDRSQGLRIDVLFLGGDGIYLSTELVEDRNPLARGKIYEYRGTFSVTGGKPFVEILGKKFPREQRGGWTIPRCFVNPGVWKFNKRNTEGRSIIAESTGNKRARETESGFEFPVELDRSDCRIPVVTGEMSKSLFEESPEVARSEDNDAGSGER